jgi:hypothetical protein
MLSMRVLEKYSPLAVATYPTLFGTPAVTVLALRTGVTLCARRAP